MAQHSSLGQRLYKKIMTLNVLTLKHVDLNANMTCDSKLDAYTDAQRNYSVHEWVLEIQYQRQS